MSIHPSGPSSNKPVQDLINQITKHPDSMSNVVNNFVKDNVFNKNIDNTTQQKLFNKLKEQVLENKNLPSNLAEKLASALEGAFTKCQHSLTEEQLIIDHLQSEDPDIIAQTCMQLKGRVDRFDIIQSAIEQKEAILTDHPSILGMLSYMGLNEEQRFTIVKMFIKAHPENFQIWTMKLFGLNEGHQTEIRNLIYNR